VTLLTARIVLARLLSAALLVAATAAESAPRVDRDELIRVVRTLSGPSFAGRRSGTPGNLLAREFVRDAFQGIGLAPAVPGFLQAFTFAPQLRNSRGATGVQLTSVNGANVLALESGRRPGSATIVVSAHYDHLGIVNGITYPGADDNASGIAALLAVARYLHAHPPAHTVIFAAFDAEESGLQGARAFVKSPLATPAIALDINFDMVSRNDRNEIYAAGTARNPQLKPIVADVQQRSGVVIRLGHEGAGPTGSSADDWTLQSDHGVFHQAGVPFIYFGVEDHPDYHKPTDSSDRIDPKFFGDVAEMLVDFVATADQRLP
jgi:Zn-dependent M28 family amino/carboxypeptidase